MKSTLRLAVRGAALGVVGIFGVLTIIASGGSVSSGGGDNNDTASGPTETCGGNPTSDSSGWWEIYRSDPASRCFIGRRYIFADSKEEAIQCEEDLGFLGEFWEEARLCDYYFRVNTGEDFCSVAEIIATGPENAEQCANWTNGGTSTTVTDITSQVKPNDTPQFCSNTREGSAIDAACP